MWSVLSLNQGCSKYQPFLKVHKAQLSKGFGNSLRICHWWHETGALHLPAQMCVCSWDLQRVVRLKVGGLLLVLNIKHMLLSLPHQAPHYAVTVHGCDIDYLCT